MKKYTSLLIFLAVAHFVSVGQLRWTGLGGDGQWDNAANWQGNQLPTSSSDVILDNMHYIGSYIVTFPATGTTVRSIAIAPAGTHRIELILPPANTADPGLTLTSADVALRLQNGAVFRNSSGALSGEPILLTGTVWIGNGSRYLHNTPRSHALIVGKLATGAGTENGVFEFDVKGGGPIISFAGKTFGTLELSSLANNGTRVYNVSGSTGTLIRGDLVINDGVSLNLNLKATVTIQGNYLQHGGRFNLGSNANNTLVRIAGHFSQTKGDLTTNTADDHPVIELNGTDLQLVSVAAKGIAGSVTLKVNNPAGIRLQTPVSLPYELQLAAGRISTGASNLLVLEPGCRLQVDSLTAGTFINGPMRKEGLSYTGQFLFPVGKGDTQRWLSLVQATGSYTVEFHKSNPHSRGSYYASPIHHISSIEHWSVAADAVAPQAQVKLSFNDPNSGGVTDLSALRVAWLQGGKWVDAGKTAEGGSAGSNGFVVSAPITDFGSGTQYFTLASTTASFNPLLQEQRPGPATMPSFPRSGLLVPTVTTGQSQLRLDAREGTRCRLQVVNASGRICRQYQVSLERGANILPVDVSSLPAGMYFIQLTGGTDRLAPLRLIKQ